MDTRNLKALLEEASLSMGVDLDQLHATPEVRRAAQQLFRTTSNAISAWVQQNPPSDETATAKDLIKDQGVLAVYRAVTQAKERELEAKWKDFYDFDSRTRSRMLRFFKSSLKRAIEDLEKALLDSIIQS